MCLCEWICVHMLVLCVCSGTFAVISIMVGCVTERLAPDSNFVVNGTNGTETVDVDERDAYRLGIACSLTVLAGIFQVCVFLNVCVRFRSDVQVCWSEEKMPHLPWASDGVISHPKVLLGMVRFGFVVTYLSEPLVRGYTTGSACHVCVSQLKYLFGIAPTRFTGPLSLIYVSMCVCVHPVKSIIKSTLSAHILDFIT